jgi:hypothetical protein
MSASVSFNDFEPVSFDLAMLSPYCIFIQYNAN